MGAYRAYVVNLANLLLLRPESDFLTTVTRVDRFPYTQLILQRSSLTLFRNNVNWWSSLPSHDYQEVGMKVSVNNVSVIILPHMQA